MQVGTRKFLAISLAVFLLIGGSGLSLAVSSGEVMHELGLERDTDGGPSPCNNEGVLCTHGCTSHLTVHLPAVSSPPTLAVDATPSSPGVRFESASTGYTLPDNLFRPPRISLA